MDALINAISTIIKIIGYRTSKELSYLSDRLLTSVAIFTLACIFLLAGLLFIVWAIYLSFSPILSPPLAALVSGAITITFSIGMLIILRYLFRRKEKGLLQSHSIENFSLEDFGENIKLVKENPLLSMALTVIAGYLIGSSPSARNALAELVVKVLDQHLKAKRSKD